MKKEKKCKSSKSEQNIPIKNKKEFPEKFPFWARLKIGKKRTTLVIDEDLAFNKKNNEI